MTHWANAANAGSNASHFGEGATFAELLEAAIFDDVEAGIVHFPRIIQEDRNFGVTFDAGDGIDDNGFAHSLRSSLFSGIESGISNIGGLGHILGDPPKSPLKKKNFEALNTPFNQGIDILR